VNGWPRRDRREFTPASLATRQQVQDSCGVLAERCTQNQASLRQRCCGRDRRSKQRRPIRLDLTSVPGVYPIKVPVRFDTRAAADRGTDKRVSALASDIISTNENAIVISNGVRDVPNTMSFQAMKGLNEMTEKDIYVVATSLSPDEYARLNVLGQWLGKGDDVIRLHYEDQINQAVGRNRGFRQAATSTKTAVICSPRLWNNVVSKLHETGTSRTLLYPESSRLW
jgi:hypothetical protein